MSRPERGADRHTPEGVTFSDQDIVPPERQLVERSADSKQSSRWSTAWQVLLPLLLLGLGVFAVAWLLETKPKPERKEASELSAKVRTVTVRPERVELSVEARGRVEAAQRAKMGALVSGPITWVSDELMPGGQFDEGDTLLRIDPREYRLAVETRKGEVSRARLDLDREKNRLLVSQKAWELYQSRKGEPEAPASPLALNVPQLAAAEQALMAGESQLQRAELSLARTRLIAPFDAVVESEEVDLGQNVSPNAVLVTLVGRDHYWVRTSIEVAGVGLIDVPGVRGAKKGSAVTIRYRSQGQTSTRQGEVLRIQAALDEEGMMAQVIVRVDDPLGIERKEPGPPLLIGAFTDVEIAAGERDGIYKLPIGALRERDRVWIDGNDQRLRIEKVEVARIDEQFAYVESGLSNGQKVVTSAISLPIEGMALELER